MRLGIAHRVFFVAVERQRRLVRPVTQRVVGQQLSCQRRNRRVVDAMGLDTEPGRLQRDHRPARERVENRGTVGIVLGQLGHELVVHGVVAGHGVAHQLAQAILLCFVIGPRQQRADHRCLGLCQRACREPGEQRLLGVARTPALPGVGGDLRAREPALDHVRHAGPPARMPAPDLPTPQPSYAASPTADLWPEPCVR